MLNPYTGLKNAFLLFCFITVFVSFSDVYAMEPSETVVSDGTLLQAHTDIFLDRLKCVHPFLPSLPPSIYVIYDKNDLGPIHFC